MERTIKGKRYEHSVCKKYGWTPKRTFSHARFTLMDAIICNFNTNRLNDYAIHKRPFGTKSDALDKKGTPIEIKQYHLFDKKGKRMMKPFSEYLSIKSYRDIYKLICEYYEIPYFNWNGGKKKYFDFTGLYQHDKRFIPLENISKLDPIKRKRYYKFVLGYCKTSGVNEWFNSFVDTDQVKSIFHNWIRQFKRSNFYISTKDGIFHNSQVVFNVRLVESHWGFKRMTVFVKLKKNR
jgi:hypothetical protein